MEPDKNTSPETEKEAPKEDAQQAPADALSRTPEELAEDQSVEDLDAAAEKEAEKKISPIKKFIKKVNIYFLIFVLLIIVATVLGVVNYLNSTQVAPEPSIASQALTEDALKQLANTDATVGNTSQTLTIQGNAIISGETLARGNLNVAGNLQTGGSIQGPTLTISGASNLGDTQINSLQVATDTAIQGDTTLRNLTVSGGSSFSGPLTASQITVTRLILSGNATLEIPNHISFTGPSPRQAINSSVIGSGGTASINGSDTAGSIRINTGNSPTTGCLVNVTFQQVYPKQPYVIVSPVGNAASRVDYYVDRNTTGFSLCSSNAAPGNQSFSFDYLVTF